MPAAPVCRAAQRAEQLSREAAPGDTGAGSGQLCHLWAEQMNPLHRLEKTDKGLRGYHER